MPTTRVLRVRAAELMRRTIDVLGSFGLAVTLLIVLLVLTFVGTFAQGQMSLYDVQARYFESLITVVDAGPISIPLPGAALALALLSLNLLVGGVLRLRRGTATIGILVGHLGILLLFAGGLVETLASDKGQMTLYEGTEGGPSLSNRFQSFYEWELAIGERRPDGSLVEHVIPSSATSDLEGRTLRATAKTLPFDVVVSGWVRNGRPRPTAAAGRGADGWEIEPLEPAHDAERNFPAAEVTLAAPGTNEGPRDLVWGGQVSPWTAIVQGRRFEVDLRHRSWSLPFALRLDRFVHETHPGTRMDSRFSSYVTKVEDGVERSVHITMNEPLRHGGYTFYQSGWGPPDAPPGAPHFSTFSVVRNPSDRVPILACFVIAAGLVIHFVRKLVLHVRSESRSPARTRPVPARRAVPAWVRKAGVATLALAVAAAAALPALASGSRSTPAWTAATLEAAASIPLQEGGRVKPLDSHAAFTLLRLNHKRSFVDAEGRSGTALEWMLDVLFRPDVARRHPCFLVEDSQVLDAVGLAHEAKKRRDRYSFEDLEPVRPRLSSLAGTYVAIDSKQRSQVENGVVDLWGDVSTFDALSHAFDFARAEVPLPDAPAVRALWPGRERVAILEVLERLAALDALAGTADPHAGVVGAPALGSGRGGGDAEAAAALRGRAFQDLGAAAAIALVPPATTEAADRTWKSPGGLLLDAAAGRPAPEPETDLVRRLVALTRSAGEPRAFEREVLGFREASAALAGARGEQSAVRLEVFLNRLDPFYRAIYLYLAAFLMIAVSWLRPSRWLPRAAWLLVLAGAIVHVTGIVVRSVLRGHPPISTLYDTTLSIAFIGVAGCLVAERTRRRGVALALAPVLGGLLLFVGQRFEVLKGEDTLPQLVAVLDTNFWLALHVTCITIGYGGGLLASAVAHVHVLGRVVGLRRDDAGFYALLARMTYGMLGFALVFSVVGTILGGIWANESWGRFWGWDPKENGALMICLAQLAILHARMGGLLQPFGVAVATIGMGCVVAFSWWGVNLLGIGLHSYGFTGGIMTGLMAFYAVESLVLAAAAATRLSGRAYAARGAAGASA